MNKVKRLRDIPIQFYVTSSENEMIKDKAQYCNLSKSEYIRQISMDGIIIKRDLKGIEEINKIGVNINQIAKKANEQGGLIQNDVDELRSQYEKLFELIYADLLEG